MPTKKKRAGLLGRQQNAGCHTTPILFPTEPFPWRAFTWLLIIAALWLLVLISLDLLLFGKSFFLWIQGHSLSGFLSHMSTSSQLLPIVLRINPVPILDYQDMFVSWLDPCHYPWSLTSSHTSACRHLNHAPCLRAFLHAVWSFPLEDHPIPPSGLCLSSNCSSKFTSWGKYFLIPFTWSTRCCPLFQSFPLLFLCCICQFMYLLDYQWMYLLH